MHVERKGFKIVVVHAQPLTPHLPPLFIVGASVQQTHQYKNNNRETKLNQNKHASLCTTAPNIVSLHFPLRIVTGQMDGSLCLIGYNGLLYHSVPAHDKAISVLRWYGSKILTGGYDSAVKVHCISTVGNSLVCTNSVYVHSGNITAVTMVEVSRWNWCVWNEAFLLYCRDGDGFACIQQLND